MLRKLMLLTLIALSTLSVCAFADTSSGQTQDFSSQIVQRLKDQLNLSDDQTSKIQDILKNSYGGTQQERDQYFQQMKQKRQDVQNQISSVLNDEQKQKYQTIEQEHQNHGGQGQGQNQNGSGNPSWQGGRPDWNQNNNTGGGNEGRRHHHHNHGQGSWDNDAR